MPLWIADYVADTTHLNAAQSGAYLHLIMHYWQHDGLPNDDAQLAQIARMKLGEWRRNRALIECFFQANWKHKRIEIELAEAKEKYLKRATAGRGGGLKNGENRRKNKQNSGPATGEAADDTEAMLQANGKQCFKQTESKNEPTTTTITFTQDDGGGDARARENECAEKDKAGLQARAHHLAKKIAAMCGEETTQKFDATGWRGARERTAKWLAEDLPEEQIIISVREQLARKRGGPPVSIVYFEQGIMRHMAEVSAPLPEPVSYAAPQVTIVNGASNAKATSGRTEPDWRKRKDQLDAAWDGVLHTLDEKFPG